MNDKEFENSDIQTSIKTIIDGFKKDHENLDAIINFGIFGEEKEMM